MSNYIIEDGELKHYGVLGMKWGVRRARKKGETYTYRSHGQKKWEKKLAKATTKGNEKKIAKAKRKSEVFKQRDKNRQIFAESTKAGSSFVRTVLMTPWGNGSYSRMRSAGHGRSISFITGGFLPPLLSIPISRASEFNTAKYETGRR